MNESTETAATSTSASVLSALTPDAAPDGAQPRPGGEKRDGGKQRKPAPGKVTTVGGGPARDAETAAGTDGGDPGDVLTATAVIPPSSGGESVKAGDPPKPGRPPAAVLAALALAGVALLAIPLALSQFGHDDKGKGHKVTALPPGQVENGYGGFVPAAPSDGPTAPAAGPTDSAAPPSRATTGHPTAGTAPTGPAGTGSGKTGTGAAGPAGSAGSGGGSGSGTTTKPAAATTFTAMAGPGCAAAGGTGYRENGRYSDGVKGWLSTSGGSCGSFTSIPMSGDASTSDSGLYADWSFSPGKYARCVLSVYIPASSDITRVGGHPANYVLRHTDGSLFGYFNLDQVAHRGSWVTVGTVTDGKPFGVRLKNRGIDYTTATKDAHVAASGVKAVCS